MHTQRQPPSHSGAGTTPIVIIVGHDDQHALHGSLSVFGAHWLTGNVQVSDCRATCCQVIRQSSTVVQRHARTGVPRQYPGHTPS